MPRQEVAPAAEIWSKEYKYTVKGTIDLSPEGRIMNPVITSYSAMPDALVDLAPTPDQVSLFRHHLIYETRLTSRIGDERMRQFEIRLTIQIKN